MLQAAPGSHMVLWPGGGAEASADLPPRQCVQEEQAGDSGETLNDFWIRLIFLTLSRDTLPLQLTSLMTNTLPSRDLTWNLMAQIKPQKRQAWESGWYVQAQLRPSA